MPVSAIDVPELRVGAIDLHVGKLGARIRGAVGVAVNRIETIPVKAVAAVKVRLTHVRPVAVNIPRYQPGNVHPVLDGTLLHDRQVIVDILKVGIGSASHRDKYPVALNPRGRSRG